MVFQYSQSLTPPRVWAGNEQRTCVCLFVTPGTPSILELDTQAILNGSSNLLRKLVCLGLKCFQKIMCVTNILVHVDDEQCSKMGL